MRCTQPRSPLSSSLAARVIARRPRHRQRKEYPKALSRGLTLRQLLPPAPPPPRLPFLSRVYQSVHDAFVRLESRGGHAYNHHEEGIEKEGREHAPLTKAWFYSEPPRAHHVVELHACSHTIVELTNGRGHILWHVKTGEYYCPEEGSINGVVRFGKVDKSYIRRNSFLPRQLLYPTNHKSHIGGRTVRPETTLLLRQDPHALTVLAEAASDDLQQYLAGVRDQRDAPVVTALCPILLFVEYHDSGIFPLLRHLTFPPNTDDDIEQSPAQDRR